LASRAIHGVVNVWDVGKGEVQFALIGHTNNINKLVIIIDLSRVSAVSLTVGVFSDSQQFVNALRNLSAAAAKGKGTHTQDTTIAPIMTQASAAKDRVKLHVEQRGGHSGPIWSLMFAEGQSLGEISQKPPVLLALVRQLFQDKT